MLEYAEPFLKLIEELKKLPGIGHKSAQRLAFHILRADREETDQLLSAINDVKEKIIFCSVCHNITDIDPCRYCTSPSRDRHVILVVEEPYNLITIEKTREYHGLYHVLHGALSPIRGIGPDQLRIISLLERLKGEEVREVILATNCTNGHNHMPRM